MRASLVITVVLAVSGLAAPAALATTQQSRSGAVSARFSFTGHYPQYKGLRLRIAQSGKVLYDKKVSSPTCGRFCAPGATGRHASSVHVIDLEHTGRPDVVLDLFSGGAHCCSIEQVFSFDPGTMTYVKTERNFGDPGERIEDLGHDGRFEFVTADDAFAYTFTDFAASGLPVQILTFSGRRFHDVTDSYPALVRKDAAVWRKAFKGMARQHYADSVGLIAAWAADEYRLGNKAMADRYLHKQALAGHLKSALGPTEPQGLKFVAVLQRFLRRHGYGH